MNTTHQLDLIRHSLNICITLCLLTAVLSLLAMRYVPENATAVCVVEAEKQPIKTTATLSETELTEYKAGEQLFKSNCAACHKIDRKLVGPALAGVSQKYEKEWLYQWIRNSQKMIKAGDPQALSLYNEYSQATMTAFPTLTDSEIEQILFYVDN